MGRGHPSAPAPGYETRDASARGVLNFLVILGAALVIVALACWGMFHYFTAHAVERPASDSPFADTRQLPLGPQLQVNPRQDWLKYRETQEKSLETYAWENRSAGMVRVPVEKAMELLVKKGLPVQGESQPAAKASSSPEAKPKP
jgi:hypothetical protein